MKKQLSSTKIALGVIISVGLLALTGCSESQKPLNGVYLGSNNKELLIMAFDKERPKKIAMQRVTRWAKSNVVLPIQYGKNDVIIDGGGVNIKLTVSEDGKTLQCLICTDGSMPKVYKLSKKFKEPAPFDKIAALAKKSRNMTVADKIQQALNKGAGF